MGYLALGVFHWLLTSMLMVGTLWLAYENIARSSRLLSWLAQGFFALHLLLGLPLGTVAVLHANKGLISGPRVALWALNSALWMTVLFWLQH